MLYFVIILILILYFIMWCSIKISSTINEELEEIENEGKIK